MRILDGKVTAAAIRAEIALEAAALEAQAGRRPGLAVLLVGDDKASQTYVRNKERACREVGFISEVHRLDAGISQQRLLDSIDALNARREIDGILLQLPLPAGLDSAPCLERIAPHKDVDGFHPQNMGRLMLGLPGLRPCTPAGVMELLKRHELSPAGQKAVVIGRSNIVGKPLAVMLGAKGPWADATVTICHSGTADLAGLSRSADFLFVAMGRAEFVTEEMVKPGAVVIDVGINVTEKGLCGDCNFASVSRVASALTPVPGGIGPMTIAMLLRNTLQAYKAHTQAQQN
ncbi:bifunctional methylenetetrahydrofolate dehydrogenase/methenyltetrahydrofolate cyclohydrolase FolD [Desulfovibrio sp. OttesenSCG-928-A18]|nr:bifunctional methylenetetrahydrofolate dehydrogenase/methenyltetrahydrofolate cyclohydrolase FolD [Desulfovibrio sp. OttesenSCG-928-A18]